MLPSFHRAITATLVAVETPAGPSGEAAEARDIDAFVTAQLLALPAHMRAAVQVAATTLVVWTLVTHRSAFDHLDATARRALLERWEASRLPTASLYLHLMRQLVLFASHEYAPAP